MGLPRVAAVANAAERDSGGNRVAFMNGHRASLQMPQEHPSAAAVEHDVVASHVRTVRLWR